MRILKATAIFFLSLGVLIASFLAVTPWKEWGGDWIQEKLNAQGIPVQELTLSHLSLTHAEFENITINFASPLTIPTMRLEYSYQNLFEKKIPHIEIANINYRYEAVQKNGEPDTKPNALPEPSLLTNLPIDHISITESTVSYGDQTNTLTIPFTAEISPHSPNALIQLSGKEALLESKDKSMRIAVPRWEGKITTDGNQFNTALEFSRVIINMSNSSSTKGTPAPLPAMTFPTIEDITLTSIEAPDISIYYANGELNSTTELSASFSHKSKTPIFRLKGMSEIQSDTNNASLPFTGTLSFSPNAKLSLVSSPAKLKIGKQNYTANKLTLTLQTATRHWPINIESTPIESDTEEAPLYLPASVKSNLSLSANSVKGSLQLSGKDLQLHSDILSEWAKNTYTLISPVLSVAQGKITAPEITYRGPQTPLNAKLTFHQIRLEELLQLILKDEKSVQATGQLSGTLPISYSDGKLTFDEGQLHSLSSGVLSLGEQHLGALPQNVEHVSQVVELLKRFEYDSLTLQTSKQENGTLGITVALKGQNSNVYNGAKVHLNINLRGDVMEAITSALGIYDTPERYLKGARP